MDLLDKDNVYKHRKWRRIFAKGRLEILWDQFSKLSNKIFILSEALIPRVSIMGGEDICNNEVIQGLASLAANF